MSISELFESGAHRKNVSHFMAMVNLAQVDGKIKPIEDMALRKLAFKMDIPEDQFTMLIQCNDGFPPIGTYGHKERVVRLYDLLSIINADREIDRAEYGLICKYGIALGFSDQEAKEEICKYLRVYDSRREFED